MNTEFILNYFKERLLSLEEDMPLIRAENISLPNDCFDSREKVFWIDLSIHFKEKTILTDAEELQRFQIICRVNVMRNAGYVTLVRAVEKITDLWSDRVSVKAGFQSAESQFYIRKIECRSVAVLNNVSAEDVIIDFDCIYAM